MAQSGDAVVTEMASSASTAGEQAPDALAVQVPYILAVLESLGIAVVGLDGYEADDVIGTLAATAPMPVDVVTGDRDLFQVVDDDRQVRVLYIARGVGKHERVDDAWVRGRYGVPAAAYVDYATLRGDASDGLPGVSGIGEKTAASLLGSYGSLDGHPRRRQPSRTPRSAVRSAPSWPPRSTTWPWHRPSWPWPETSTSGWASTTCGCPTARRSGAVRRADRAARSRAPAPPGSWPHSGVPADAPDD